MIAKFFGAVLFVTLVVELYSYVPDGFVLYTFGGLTILYLAAEIVEGYINRRRPSTFMYDRPTSIAQAPLLDFITIANNEPPNNVQKNVKMNVSPIAPLFPVGDKENTPKESRGKLYPDSHVSVNMNGNNDNDNNNDDSFEKNMMERNLRNASGCISNMCNY